MLSKKKAPVEPPINPIALLNSIGLPASFLQENTNQTSSLFYVDPKHNLTMSSNLNNFEEFCKGVGERFLCCATLHEVQKYCEWTMILTDKGFYKLEVDSPMHAPRKRKALLDFHSVEADSSNPLLLTTRIYKGSVKSNMKSSLFKFMGNLGSKIDSESFLQVRQYVCESELQRDQLVWILNRSVRNIWQSTLETHIIPEPEYYQAHQFVIKTNRKGAHQERLLTLSNEWMYNLQVSHAPTTIHSVKWAIRLDCISSIMLEEGNVAKFFFHKDKLEQMIEKYRDEDRLGVNNKVVNDYIFSFRDDVARAFFVATLKYRYGVMTGDESKLLILNNVTAIPPPPPASEYGTSSTMSQGASQPESQIPQNSTTTDPAAPVPASSVMTASSPLIKDMKPLNENTYLLCEPLEKMVKGSTRSHVKVFALYPNLTIKWGDSEKKFKYSAKILSVISAPDILNSLAPEKKPCFFALRTSEKPLLLLTKSATDKATWLNVVQSLLDSDTHTSGASETLKHATSIQGTVPMIKGPMMKYIKGGKDKHTKHFCVYNNGTIKWGSGDGVYKHTAQVVEIDQDISSLGDKIDHEDAIRFIRIITSDKTLELLCPNQHSADRWMMIVNSIIHPESVNQLDLLDSDEDDE